MMRQYFAIKEKNKESILFFRVGDFYEMFFDDAQLASRELELTLTGKECGQEERAPMCGVPYHSVEAYVGRLIEKGYKVAICDQTEDAALAKGLVEREVVRVVTPGTVIENSLLADDRNNYIAGICAVGGSAGLCFADISTGQSFFTVAGGADMQKRVIAELCRYAPREILMNAGLLSHGEVTGYIRQCLPAGVELLDDADFERDSAFGAVRAQFGGAADAELFTPEWEPALCAGGALLAYLARTQKRGIERLSGMKLYRSVQYMRLPPSARANLELCETMRGREKKGTLLWVLDQTFTAMGRRLVRSWIEQPLTDIDGINARLDGVEELYRDNVTRIELGEKLGGFADMERLLTRIVYGSAAPREVAALAAACGRLPEILRLTRGFESGIMALLREEIDPLRDIYDAVCETLADDVPALLRDGGLIRRGFSPEVDELRDIVHGGKGLLAGIEAKLKEETGIRTLKIGFNKVFGYYIEVSKSFTDAVPAHFVRKQTLTGGERYITDELKRIENRILGAGDRLDALERELFAQLLQKIASQTPRIQRTAAGVAKLDVLAGFAQAAVAGGYVRPQVHGGGEITVSEGRHPVVERMLAGQMFVPNDVRLDCEDNRLHIVTGPNMAGKSTYMRQIALIVIMAQAGSFVPAAQCSVGVCDAVYTRVGASDDLGAGRSTFMVEMNEVAEIMQDATARSLVVLDEIGRGTSTFDGMSIAQAVLEFMAAKDTGPACKTLFATHYHELTELEKSIDGVKNYNVAVKKRGDDITFLRRIVRGAADDSYGIQVAKLAGLPETVIARAKDVLRVLERNQKSASRVTQLDFETIDAWQSEQAPGELVQKLRGVDPETLTPLEALTLVYELKQALVE